MWTSPLMTVFLYALLTAVCTGLGALPFAFKKKLSRKRIAKANAIAAALMIAASFGLIYEGLNLAVNNSMSVDVPFFSQMIAGVSGATWGVVGGVVVGLVFILLCDDIIERYDHLKVYDLKKADAKKVLLIVGIMTLHSFTEGVAVGVSFGPSMAFGLFIALAIALHNIPEGLAISAVLVPKGFKWRQAAWRSIFSSLPQPIMAIPAFLFVHIFAPFLPFGLGFAAGAMIWMAISELLPDALNDLSSSQVATIATLSIVCMVLFQQLLTLS